MAIVAYKKGWNLLDLLRMAVPKYSSLPRIQRIVVVPNKLSELKLNKVFRLSELCMIGCLIYEMLRKDEEKARSLLGDSFADILSLMEKDPRSANKLLRDLI